ncbi:shikimate dehydrogenase family protein [Microbacterium sediminis]|uniref:Shikimate dehydrogenase n=1 Tax=Microbacterium sediminis TaxID=904291 RepID=A0A1B9NCM6_9MICO|nr:shikimate dehydrogenase [Microbacterium sediminis]OCG74355.1 shikimate dehydrogenase [Microbacterium sediminis]QBR73721.1 shikimate dehydrogenase [Microbacterium sediminis]
MYPTLTPRTLTPAAKPTFYFIGVTTGHSSIRRVFPAWADALGLGDVEMMGIDVAIHADAADYRSVVTFIKNDPLSLGALVTTHKIDIFDAAHDLFDEIDPLATLMHEISCISKSDGRLCASAKDPISSGHALDAFIPEGHFARTGAELCVFGAGGSAIAIDWYLSQPARGADRPARVTVTNRSQPRLDALRAIHEQSAPDVPLRLVLAGSASDNDAVLAELPPQSVVINATGLGKDAPGSPLSDEALFPEGALAWDLNYRGDLVFLDQAEAQRAGRGVEPVDGWIYFIHGWTQVIAEVFHIDIPPSGERFDELVAIAAASR